MRDRGRGRGRKTQRKRVCERDSGEGKKERSRDVLLIIQAISLAKLLHSCCVATFPDLNIFGQ
jgi:hypothetical protein